MKEEKPKKYLYKLASGFANISAIDVSVEKVDSPKERKKERNENIIYNPVTTEILMKRQQLDEFYEYNKWKRMSLTGKNEKE